MPALELTEDEISTLAMACRSAAHHANGRRLQERRGSGLAVSPETFVKLAERLESFRSVLARQQMHNVTELSAEERARLGWGPGRGSE